MKHFKAYMHYDKDTIYDLAKTISHIKAPWAKPLLYIICIFSIASGFFYFTTTPVQLAAIAFGCLLFTSMNVPAMHKANQSINAVGGKAFIVNYIFEEDILSITSTIGQKNKLFYSQIIDLAESRKYLYIFSDLSSAYMIEKLSVNNGAWNELMIFLSLKSNKHWKKIFRIF